jgi:hypothetical protein
VVRSPLKAKGDLDFRNVEQAKAFAASAELKATMEKAGVKGAPQIWITTKAGQ